MQVIQINNIKVIKDKSIFICIRYIRITINKSTVSAKHRVTDEDCAIKIVDKRICHQYSHANIGNSNTNHNNNNNNMSSSDSVNIFGNLLFLWSGSIDIN